MASEEFDGEDFDDEDFDYLDEQLFGCGDSGATYYPQSNELNWDEHFLNNRESGAGPDVDEYSTEALLDMGYTKSEIAESLRKKADELEEE